MPLPTDAAPPLTSTYDLVPPPEDPGLALTIIAELGAVRTSLRLLATTNDLLRRLLVTQTAILASLCDGPGTSTPDDYLAAATDQVGTVFPDITS